MDLNFYSDLSGQNVDSEFLDTQAYGAYTEENKVTIDHRSVWCGVVVKFLH